MGWIGRECGDKTGGVEVFRFAAMVADGMGWGVQSCPDTDKTSKTKQWCKHIHSHAHTC